MSRCCSQCGSNGHNSRTCGGGSSSASAADGGGGSDSGSGPISEFMLFGVRVKVDPMRKSVSMNNLSDYEHHPSNASTVQKNSVHLDASAPKAADDVAAGYASADDALPTHHSSTAARERKRGLFEITPSLLLVIYLFIYFYVMLRKKNLFSSLSVYVLE